MSGYLDSLVATIQADVAGLRTDLGRRAKEAERQARYESNFRSGLEGYGLLCMMTDDPAIAIEWCKVHTEDSGLEVSQEAPGEIDEGDSESQARRRVQHDVWHLAPSLRRRGSWIAVRQAQRTVAHG